MKKAVEMDPKSVGGRAITDDVIGGGPPTKQNQPRYCREPSTCEWIIIVEQFYKS